MAEKRNGSNSFAVFSITDAADEYRSKKFKSKRGQDLPVEESKSWTRKGSEKTISKTNGYRAHNGDQNVGKSSKYELEIENQKIHFPPFLELEQSNRIELNFINREKKKEMEKWVSLWVGYRSLHSS